MIIDQVLAASIALTTPILLAAMGGLVNRQGGIVNIALDAKMLAGAFVAVVVSSATGNWFAAILAAAFVGASVGLVFSLVITRAGANMIVAGLGLNVLVAGVLGFILNWFYDSSGTLRLQDVALLPHIFGDGVKDIPIVGLTLSRLDPLTIFAWLTVLCLPWALANTRAGLRVRATGNAPKVAHAMGISELRVQDGTTMFAGFFSGLAGAHLALASIGLFNEGLTAGRGFIALAAFYFGRDRPVTTALVCLLFGFLDATQIRMQTAGLPPKLIGTIPYLMVLVALCIAGWRNRRTKDQLA
ncbi:ABC transporter permease [Hoeflea prorocentri]|uniref:ABC transporter permease n=1 Tax=Hoeflea prorocentri TaxID=1922333 RepID=A0A9X3UJE1_9HYPH|nr:ABC transporter permease [Hoeflea prorocentri]MCY6380194.1 ABC transporter permease [Hoeflea prorocentri]MDA5397994.1 ABC transporter permease [Hoeflea prorocentri]